MPKELQKIEELAKRNLRKVARRERWPPRDDEEILTPSSGEIEVEGKKQRTDITSFDEETAGINMVYVLSLSFRATTS